MGGNGDGDEKGWRSGGVGGDGSESPPAACEGDEGEGEDPGKGWGAAAGWRATRGDAGGTLGATAETVEKDCRDAVSTSLLWAGSTNSW